MASLTQRKGSGRYIVVVCIMGRQKYVYTKTVKRTYAERILLHVSELELAAKNNRSVNAETSAWVSQLYENPATHKLFDSLARIGLVESRESIRQRVDAEANSALEAERVRLEAEDNLNIAIDRLANEHIESLLDVREGTRRIYRQSKAAMLKYFGGNARVRDVDANHAMAYQRWLRKEFEQATSAKYIKHAKAFFQRAVRAKLIEVNPFAGVKPGTDHNPERQYYVTPELISNVIESVVDVEWKLVIGLAYYAALRCPSEVCSLRWSDVDYANHAFMVATPKTAGHGRSVKRVPLFPELEALLLKGFEGARPGAEFVIDRLQKGSKSFGARFKKIIENAGFKPWPKLFNNLRSSRRTYLERTSKFTAKALDEWFGHDTATAKKHYVQVGDHDFAIGAEHWSSDAKSVSKAQGKAQGSRAKMSEIGRKGESQSQNVQIEKSRENLPNHSTIPNEKGRSPFLASGLVMTPTGIEPVSRP